MREYIINNLVTMGGDRRGQGLGGIAVADVRSATGPLRGCGGPGGEAPKPWSPGSQCAEGSPPAQARVVKQRRRRGAGPHHGVEWLHIITNYFYLVDKHALHTVRVS
jgi:hypothetical protein